MPRGASSSIPHHFEGSCCLCCQRDSLRQPATALAAPSKRNGQRLLTATPMYSYVASRLRHDRKASHDLIPYPRMYESQDGCDCQDNEALSAVDCCCLVIYFLGHDVSSLHLTPFWRRSSLPMPLMRGANSLQMVTSLPSCRLDIMDAVPRTSFLLSCFHKSQTARYDKKQKQRPKRWREDLRSFCCPGLPRHWLLPLHGALASQVHPKHFPAMTQSLALTPCVGLLEAPSWTRGILRFRMP